MGRIGGGRLKVFTPIFLSSVADGRWFPAEFGTFSISMPLLPIAWAKEAIVGGSTGEGRRRSSFPNTRVSTVVIRFDTRDNQWRYAIEETKIARCDWLLWLDVHYQVNVHRACRVRSERGRQ